MLLTFAPAPKLAGQGEPLPQHRLGPGDVALVAGVLAQVLQRLQARGRGPRVGGQGALQPGVALGPVAGHAPEVAESRRQPQEGLGLVARREPGQRGPQVAVLALQSRQPRARPWPAQQRRRPLGERQAVGGVGGADGRLLAAVGQLLQPELAHRLQHA